MHFVETNPDANNNIPDKTNNFGAQNQQAAQPVPDKDSTLRMPKTEGKKDFAERLAGGLRPAAEARA